MLAQRKYTPVDQTIKLPRKRKRKSFLRALARNQMACVLLAAAFACLLLGAYVGAYARFTEKGYRRTALSIKLQQIERENERLRISLEALRQPERIEKFALDSGMRQGEKLAYLSPANRPHMARNTVRPLAR